MILLCTIFSMLITDATLYINSMKLDYSYIDINKQVSLKQDEIDKLNNEISSIENQPKMSIDEFALRIKSKYPQYRNVDNNSLAKKIIKKW